METKRTSLYFYHGSIVILTLITVFFFHLLTKNKTEKHLFAEKCFVGCISSFLNMFVLHYHFTNAPHPKFVILKRRRISIIVHVVSGVIEFFSCWLAFITGKPIFAVIGALSAIFGHVPSAYYQTTIIFGAKALMVSGYIFFISLHLFSAIQLLSQPSSIYWLLNMFLVHNVYVWVRVMYFAFRAVGLFSDSVYTTSVAFAGLLLGPSIIGIAGNILFILYVLSYIGLYYLILHPSEEQKKEFVCEHSRGILVNAEAQEAWKRNQKKMASNKDFDQMTEKQKAKIVFDSLSKDENVTLDAEEIAELLKEWQTNPEYIEKFVNLAKKQDITFDLFFKHVWNLGGFSVDHTKKRKGMEAQEKAKYIFEQLDLDGSGHIDRIELQQLLTKWGLPQSESDDYLRTDDDKLISLEEFYQNFRPIWEFAYENLSFTAGH